jgi:TPR repeat protein
MLNLGACYSYGKGVEKDLVTGLQWFQRSAVLGDSDAMCTAPFQLNPNDVIRFANRFASAL